VEGHRANRLAIDFGDHTVQPLRILVGADRRTDVTTGNPHMEATSSRSHGRSTSSTSRT
jgi:hypothetical protein